MILVTILYILWVKYSTDAFTTFGHFIRSLTAFVSTAALVGLPSMSTTYDYRGTGLKLDDRRHDYRPQ